MAMTAAQYLAQLQALLPSGMAWARASDAVLTRLLAAWADELARIEGRVGDLLDQADPLTASEMFADWETVAGLPDLCLAMTGEEQGLAGRRDALLARLTAEGGSSIAYFISIAASLGFTITIEEFREFKVGVSAVGESLTNGGWAFAWQVNADAVTVRDFAVGQAAVGEPLRSWGNALLECALNSLKPAGTTAIFAYN